MKIKLILITLSVITLYSCKKGKPEITPEPVRYSKIESFLTPYENEQLVPSKRFLLSSKSFDNSGHLTLYLYRVFGTDLVDTVDNTLQKSTYKYENNRIVEEDVLSIAKAIHQVDVKVKLTYTSKGDTSEVTIYDNQTSKLSGRYVYFYGSNGMKSKITCYSVTDEVGSPAGTEFYSHFFKYDDNKNIIELSEILPDAKNTVNYTIKYVYNSKNNLIKATNITYHFGPYYEGQYQYDEKGRIVEYTKTHNPGVPESWSTRFVNSYNNDGQLSKQILYSGTFQIGIIEYFYIK